MPALTFGRFTVPSAKRLCLQGVALAVTGVFPQLDREEVCDIIKTYGGTVTGSVSGKTHYLLTGDALESGDPVSASAKYRAAKERGVPTLTLPAFLEFLASRPAQEPAPLPTKPAPKRSTPKAPRAVAKVGGSMPMARPAQRQRGAEEAMWVDRYKPASVEDLVGNKALIGRLVAWLKDWEAIHIKKTKPKPAFDARAGTNPGARAVLLSGPPGIGKSTAALLVARAVGYQVQEMNASDTRSKRSLKETLAEVVGNRAITFFARAPGGGSAAPGGGATTARQVVIMDEVDGMSSGDRGGNAELIRIIKTTRRPIICICNDRQKSSVRSLANSCLDLKFSRPNKQQVAKRLALIAAEQGLAAEPNALEYLVETSGNDIRQTVHMLQMWANSPHGADGRLTFAAMKAAEATSQKDKSLRLNGFDVTKTLFSDVRSSTFTERYNSFFVDYDLIPLLVQQAMPQSVQTPRGEAPTSKLARMADAADAIALSDVMSNCVRMRGQWSLLTSVAAMNVKAAYHASGSVAFPGFPEWFGKNSTMGKRRRLLGELSMHLNHRVSGGSQSLRMHYMETLKSAFYAPMLEKGADGVPDTIAMLDSYGLSKQDLTESLQEFQFKGITTDWFARVPGAVKSKLTRAYNASTHRSQALQDDVSLGGRKRKGAPSTPVSLESVADDGVAREGTLSADEEEELDEDAATVAAKFKKKSKAKGKGKGKRATPSKRARK